MNHFRMVWSDRGGFGMAYGAPDVDMFAPPSPGQVRFELQGGRPADYQANTFAWRLCSERLMDVLRREAAANDDPSWIQVIVETPAKLDYFALRSPPRRELLHSSSVITPDGNVLKPILDGTLAQKHKIFELFKEDISIYVAEEVKEKIKAAKLAGMEFRPARTAR